MSSNTKPTTRDINAAQRAALAMSLRAKKLTYEEIARQCGYADRGTCHNAVQRELARRVIPNVDEMRREELAMLDTLHSECWELAMDKKSTYRLFAVDRILAISERRSKLMGLDIPIDQAMNNNLLVVREIPQGWLTVEAPKT